MNRVKKISKWICVPLLVVAMAIVVTSFSPVYNFTPAAPFSGNDIFNPYRNFDHNTKWSRANFHTHTKVDGLLNECEHTPEQVIEYYDKFDYDIVGFSNHNCLTSYSTDSIHKITIYEHGYNLFKFHKLVFGCSEVNHFDHLLPIFASQKQFILDLLGHNSDLVVFNHPIRTSALDSYQMQLLGGYDIIELDSGRSTENRYWDEALTAGNYSFALANDDLHYPDRSNAIARRCNFLQVTSNSYSDIRSTLKQGCYYSMRVPDYGNGDWQQKIECNRHLPAIKNIGVDGNTVYIALTEAADSIKVIGQHHTTLAKGTACDSLSYTMAESDSYSRFIAYFAQGEVIYSNPFARYDSAVSDRPTTRAAAEINIPLTILFNLTLVVLLISIVVIVIKTIFVWRD